MRRSQWSLFLVMPGANPREEAALNCKNNTRLERLAKNKHSSLLVPFVSFGRNLISFVHCPLTDFETLFKDKYYNFLAIK
jgi:hypothetical protein